MSEKANAITHVFKLSKEIGPRRPTSENERKASEYISSFLTQQGLDPVTEQFKAPATFSWTYVLLFGIFIVAFLVFYFYGTFVGALLSILGLVLFILEGSSKETISKVVPKGISQNVWAVIKPKNTETKKILLVAHYDSSRAAWFFNPSFVKYFRPLFVLMFSSAVLSAIMLTIDALVIALIPSQVLGISLHTLISYLIYIPMFFLVLGFVSMIHRELFHKDVPGANDNASGVSVLLELASILSKEPLENTSVTVLATGSEESGMYGMIKFLEKHGHQYRKAYIINFDNLGVGKSYYVVGEGIITTVKSDPELIKLAEAVSKENPNLGFKSIVYKLLPTDATPAIIRGFKAMSIMSFDENKLLPHWHWYTDIAENVEKETLNRVLKFSLALVKKIDSIK